MVPGAEAVEEFCSYLALPPVSALLVERTGRRKIQELAYGATSGAAGTSVTNESITQTSGTQSGAQCTPDMTLTKSHAPTTLTRGSTVIYTIPVENVSPYGSSNATVTVNDTLPLGLTPISASGTGWSCSIASQTV